MVDYFSLLEFVAWLLLLICIYCLSVLWLDSFLVWKNAPKTSYTRFIVQDQNLRVFCCTWNMGDAQVKPEQLSNLLGANETTSNFDILVFGTQECHWRSVREVGAEWRSVLQQFVGDQFSLVDFVDTRDSLRLVVFVSNKHFPHTSVLQRSSCIIGIPLFYRKGGQLIALQIYDTKLGFVNAHLTAHQNNINGRNRNTYEIFQKLLQNVEGFSFAELDHLILMGDLNYRINVEKKKATTLASTLHKELVGHDQLATEQNKNKCLSIFEEAGSIGNFAPTYKVKRSMPVEYAHRTPSWCDRIFCMSKSEKSKAIATYYSSIPTLFSSDHFPVVAYYDVPLKKEVVSTEIEHVDISFNKARLHFDLCKEFCHYSRHDFQLEIQELNSTNPKPQKSSICSVSTNEKENNVFNLEVKPMKLLGENNRVNLHVAVRDYSSYAHNFLLGLGCVEESVTALQESGFVNVPLSVNGRKAGCLTLYLNIV